MQDLLIKIIKMDEQARKTAEIAKAEKLKSEQEVEALREQIYNDYIKRAKERIEKNIAVDQANADKRLADYEKRVEDTKTAMQQLYSDKKEEWVGEIVDRALS
nr:hypothetical protein [uncultured Ruminococcus sp.]